MQPEQLSNYSCFAAGRKFLVCFIRSASEGEISRKDILFQVHLDPTRCPRQGPDLSPLHCCWPEQSVRTLLHQFSVLGRSRLGEIVFYSLLVAYSNYTCPKQFIAAPQRCPMETKISRVVPQIPFLHCNAGVRAGDQPVQMQPQEYYQMTFSFTQR